MHEPADTPRILNFGHAWDYAPAPETTPVPLKESYQLFVDGQFVDSSTGEWFDSVNPATGKPHAKIARAGQADVDAAVAAARRAYEGVWAKTTPRDRGKFLFRIARMIQERARELAILESMDNGKPIKESRDVDLPLVAAHFFYYAGWADKLDYALPGRSPKPIGVAGQIIPWNFPLLMLAWKIAPALACGNTVVLKPAETTSVTALHMAEIFRDAGLPDGVVNIVTGAGEVGEQIVNHPDVDKIAFTGSTEVGKRIATAVAGTDKRLTLELGGKAANIVFEDAALDQAVEGIVNGIYFNQGHVCCAGSRLLVQEGVYDETIHLLENRAPNPARRRPARQKHRRRRDQLRRAVAEDSGTRRRRRRRRREAACSPAASCRETVLLVQAELLHRRHALASDRAGRNLWPGLERDDFPYSR